MELTGSCLFGPFLVLDGQMQQLFLNNRHFRQFPVLDCPYLCHEFALAKIRLGFTATLTRVGGLGRFGD
jgi:hypothetical protein